MGKIVDRVDGADFVDGDDFLRRKKTRRATVVLCEDEFCIRVARWRLVSFSLSYSNPLVLCEKCYEGLSRETQFLYEEIPFQTNKEPADRSCGGCSGCGPHP